MYKKDIHIVIADDHPMLLKGLYEELINNSYKVVGQAKNGNQALSLILLHKPDIALLDIDMPDLSGFEVIKAAKKKGSNTKFIILSFHKEKDYITKAKSLQINGYLLKEDSFFEIEQCIKEVVDNKQYFSRSFNKSNLINASLEIQKLQLLTPSEITILKLIAQQNSTSQIAETLYVSSRTVEKHRSNIILKLELESGPNSLSHWALINKLIILEL
ncbi:MAG: response regulator [Flavobacteriales bacterium]